jgi:hypothetical protein
VHRKIGSLDRLTKKRGVFFQNLGRKYFFLGQKKFFLGRNFSKRGRFKNPVGRDDSLYGIHHAQQAPSPTKHFCGDVTLISEKAFSSLWLLTYLEALTWKH